MPAERYDIVAEKEEVFTDRAGRVYEQARKRHLAGEFVQVEEFMTKPFDGITFTVDKGQS